MIAFQHDNGAVALKGPVLKANKMYEKPRKQDLIAACVAKKRFLLSKRLLS